MYYNHDDYWYFVWNDFTLTSDWYSQGLRYGKFKKKKNNKYIKFQKSAENKLSKQYFFPLINIMRGKSRSDIIIISRWTTDRTSITIECIVRGSIGAQFFWYVRSVLNVMGTIIFETWWAFQMSSWITFRDMTLYVTNVFFL